MTEKFVYLGYGITDSNGIAKLDHDANGDAISHSYTGTGAGKIDVVGSLEDISDLTINLNPATINDNSSGTTHTITATVLDDNVAVQNEEVTFEVRKQSDNSLVTTLTGTTNSSGVATVSYSGIGAGSLNIKCYCSFLTKTYEVIDGTFYDRGTNTNYHAWTGGSFTGNALQRGDDYTTLIPSETAYHYYLTITDTNLAVEFDVNFTFSQNTNTFRFTKNIWTNVAVASTTELEMVSGQWHHLKFVRDVNTFKGYCDGVLKVTKTFTDTINTWYMILDYQKNTDLKFKNFVVYPI